MKFKWSRFKNNILENIIIYFSKVEKKEIKTNKILIISNEALGDSIIKLKIIKLISDCYGKENIIILCKNKWKDIYLKESYNIIVDEYKQFFKRIVFFRKINKTNYKKIIFLNNSSYNSINRFIDSSNKFENLTNQKYILENYIPFLQTITNKTYSIKELRPNIKKMYLNSNLNNIISIGIGAANQKKTAPVELIKNIIEFLIFKYPKKQIILLGAGKKQICYTKKLLKLIKYPNIINKVGIANLNETLEIVANSDIFIGYDSGLTNAAFSFHTKYICLYWRIDKLWWHNFPNCTTLIGDKKNPINDGIHGTELLNSIKLSQIEEALNRFNL